MTSHRLLPKSRSNATRGRRLLLITGTPGTGKRPLGSYLETERGFVHVDLDNRESRTRFLRSGADALRDELATVTTTAPKIVVTWTFTAETQLAYVETMRSLGFEWIWMDSDRGSAYDALVAEAATEPPRFVDAFEPQGTFRALENVLDELRRRRRIVPRRRRAKAGAAIVPRPALAGVIAFAAAGAALFGTYLAGGFDTARPVHVSVAQSRPTGIFPVNGVLVPGESLGGIRLGDTGGKVMALWGRDYTMISGQPMTWIYMSPTGDPYGAAVSFRDGKVTAIFTLGGIRGWRRIDGLRVGQTLSTFNDPQGRTTACVGYGATSIRKGNAVTSILTNGQSIYGFALTRPSEPVCH